MRTAMLFSLIVAFAVEAGAQNAPARAGGAAKPAPAAAQKASGRSGFTIVVTNPIGMTLEGVSVQITGPSDRSGVTNPSGQLNVTGMQAGTYRLRFTGEEVTAFEREATLRANQTMSLDITLNPAPPPKEIVKTVEVPAPAPPAPAVGPVGQPQALSLVDLIERESEATLREGVVVSCSGNTRSMLLQLNQDQPERRYESADSLYYVIAGEGVVRVGDREQPLAPGGFASVPRETSFTIGRRGRRPLILLSVLSGEPCEMAK